MDELEAEEQAEPTLSVEVSIQDEATVFVRLAGELDMSNTEELEAQVAHALESSPQRIVVEAQGLEFADSSAIALWVRWAALVDHMELRNPSPLIRRVLTAMGLDATLELSP